MQKVMSSTLIIDNWYLQDISACLVEGLTSDVASEVVIDRNRNSHFFKDVPEAGVRLEALLSMLVDVVLRDQLIIDSDFKDSWEANEHVLLPLVAAGLIRDLQFRTSSHLLRQPTAAMVDKLCVTASLVEAQKKNEVTWKQSHRAADPYLSQVVWGTAGMLSRSHVFEAPYSGHPLRRRLLEQTIMSPLRADAVRATNEWIGAARLQLFSVERDGGCDRHASLIMPPIAVQIINEARTADQLLSIAVQMRDKHKNLREWLKEVQGALDAEDAKAIAAYTKTLDTVARDIHRKVSAESEVGKVSLKLGFSMPAINIQLPSLQGVLSRFGTRALLSQQVFERRGEKSLNKLLSMFGEVNSRIAIEVREYLRVPRL
jgi:hypothetical protein